MNKWKDLLKQQLNEVSEENYNQKTHALINDFLDVVKSSNLYSRKSELADEIEHFIEQINILSLSYSEASKDMIDKNYIPEIAKELNLIVKHTENSVSRILDIFDEISGLILKINNSSIKDEIISKSAQILEVCNFQDNVGQRINIIVHNLSGIENTLSSILNAINPKNISLSTNNKNPEDKLLNGPAIDAPTQQEIDELFNSL